MDIEAFPCSWPVGRPRTPAAKRERAKFSYETTSYSEWAKRDVRSNNKLTIYVGLKRVRKALNLLGATDVVISTNMPTRQDGLPYSNAREPDDPAVAVYFRLQGKVRCLPSDHWDRVADNLGAIAAHINAMRGIDRWHVGDLEQAWAGYLALPPVGAPKPWWELLGFKQPPVEFEHVKSAFRWRIAACHPDTGGSANQAAELNAAFDQAKTYYKEPDCA